MPPQKYNGASERTQTSKPLAYKANALSLSYTSLWLKGWDLNPRSPASNAGEIDQTTLPLNIQDTIIFCPLPYQTWLLMHCIRWDLNPRYTDSPNICIICC